MFYSFGTNFWGHFRYLFSFFRSWASLGRSSVFEGPPMQNASFLGARRPRKHKKRCPEGGPKMDLKTDTKKSLFGGRFWHLFWSLGPPLGHFVALLWPLGPRGPRREAQEQPKGGQELPKSRPREAKRGPGEAKREPKVPQESQREVQESSREAMRGTRQAQ